MEGEIFTNTIQVIKKTIKLCIQPSPKTPIINYCHFKFSSSPYRPFLKMNITEQGVNKCNWDDEGSVFCVKWYNGKDSHEYCYNISNNAIFNTN
jgi:hypothetical protein